MDKLAQKLSDRGIVGYLKILLRGAGQVMFQCNAWTGLFFIAGIFWVPIKVAHLPLRGAQCSA